MAELQGAVARAQLKKLDCLLERMRRNKSRIKEAISNIKGLEFRKLNDTEGDTSICLVFYLQDKDITRRFAEALKAEGVSANSLFDASIPDWHIYAHWKHIMDKVTATKEGCPYTCPYYKGEEIKYSPDMCPQTLKWLSRSIQIDIPPQMPEEDCDMIVEAIDKVSNVLL